MLNKQRKAAKRAEAEQAAKGAMRAPTCVFVCVCVCVCLCACACVRVRPGMCLCACLCYSGSLSTLC
jgi:hypothetical protein